MRWNTVMIGLVVVGGVGGLVFSRLGGDDELERRKEGGPAPVEVAEVERGAIELRRTFTGTLEARAEFVVAAHVGGRVQELLVDLADLVEDGQVVAELDDDDEVQGVAEASAELAVARASLAEAQSAFALAERELERLVGLQARGVVSESEVDAGRAAHLASKTAVEVANAQLERAQAVVARAKIRSGYTRVVARWGGGKERRAVAQRHVDEGDMVAAGDPLVTIVDLTPIDAVVYVTESEYGRLENGQGAKITADAYPERTFAGSVHRLAPVFNERSRQARMEIAIANEEGLLKPGMFVRAEVVLDAAEQASIVPLAALTSRDGETGVFIVDGSHVSWRPVQIGIRDGDRVQVLGELHGRVVTLGHQLIADGAEIIIPEQASAAAVEAP